MLTAAAATSVMRCGVRLVSQSDLFSSGYHSPEQIKAMVDAYRATCTLLGLGDGDTLEHQMVALGVEELVAWHEQKDQVVQRVAARARGLMRLLDGKASGTPST